MPERCHIYQHVQDDRTGRRVRDPEPVKVIDGAHSPAVVLSVFFEDEDPPAGMYTAECEVAGRLRCVTQFWERAA